MKLPNKFIQKGSYMTESEFEEGTTVLSEEQQKLFEEISYLLKDNYSSILRLYSPKGMVSLLRSQSITKRQYGSVELCKIEKAELLIDVLEKGILAQ